MNRLKQLYQKLGLSKANGLFLYEEFEEWVHKFPYRIGRILKEVIKPDAFFCLYNDASTASEHPRPFNQSFILFFDNPNATDEEQIHKRVINFGLAQAVFINRSSTLDLYHGNEFKITDLKRLLKKKSSNSVEDFKEFSFINILLGNSLKEVGVKKNLIDEYLLNNITDARRILVAKNGLKLPSKVANRLIGRLLFISYLIDRDVTFSDQNIIKGPDKTERKHSFRQVILNKASLYRFFKYLNKKYNGDMFPLKETSNRKLVYDEQSNVENEHLEVLYHLFNCSEIFKTGESYNGYTVQQSLFDLYDFEIIPVELISSIYENFIGNEYENEKLSLSKQKSIKAYYTPPYLVDYILSQTVTPFLESSSKVDSNCKVLDPACGSGIFLVETVRKIIEKELTISEKKKISDSKLWKLIKSNIFGIDIDSDAIDISIFSLYVTILDYKQPAEIESFKFKKLKDENFFGGPQADFFNTNHPFNKKIKNLNFIVGNPPWGQVSKSTYINYIKERDVKENRNKSIEDKLPLQIGDKEICQAFIIRTSDFATKKNIPKCCFVVSSKVLYNTENSSKAFRNYFLQKFYIKQVVELSPVNNKIRGGNHIFDAARQPAAVITFQYEPESISTRNNIVQHITVKPNRFFLYYKTIVIEKHDVKDIKQEYFIEQFDGFDWLWKVLVHGSALDIHFIKRLKQGFKSVQSYFDEFGYEAKGGLKVKDGIKKNDTSKILSYDFLDAEKEFKPFIVSPSKKWKREIELKNITLGEVGFLPEIKFFKGNKLIIKKGLTLEPRVGEHHFGAVSSFHEGNLCFTDTVFSVIPKKSNVQNSKNQLAALAGLFNSRLFTYFTLNTSSAAGIERSILRFKEAFDFPAYISAEIGDLTLSITNRHDDFGDQTTAQTKNKIEEIVSQVYQLSETEKSLIDYATEVSIPTLLREEGSSIFKHLDFANLNDKNYLDTYVNAFIQTLQKRFDQINKNLRAEVLFSDYFIRINYHIENKPGLHTFERRGNDDLEILLGDLGVYSVCKDLYVQHDVRGFTRTSFYVIKPNERKLWHKAVSYLDAIEFEEEITKAEVRQIKLKSQNERS